MKKALRVVKCCWIAVTLIYTIIIIRMLFIFSEEEFGRYEDDIRYYSDEIILSNVATNDIDSIVWETFEHARAIRDDCYIYYMLTSDYYSDKVGIARSKSIDIIFSFKRKGNKLPSGWIHAEINVRNDVVMLIIEAYHNFHQHNIYTPEKIDTAEMLNDWKIAYDMSYENASKEHDMDESNIKLLNINFRSPGEVALTFETFYGNYGYRYQKFLGVWFDYNTFWKVVLYGSVCLFIGLIFALAVLKIIVVCKNLKATSEGRKS